MTSQSIGQNQRCLEIWQLFPAMCTTYQKIQFLIEEPKIIGYDKHDLVTVTIPVRMQGPLWQWVVSSALQDSDILVWINISDDSERRPRAWVTHWWCWSDGCLMLTKYARWLVPPASHNSPAFLILIVMFSEVVLAPDLISQPHHHPTLCKLIITVTIICRSWPGAFVLELKWKYISVLLESSIP